MDVPDPLVLQIIPIILPARVPSARKEKNSSGVDRFFIRDFFAFCKEVSVKAEC
jgi:hypothetical protein